MIPCSSCECFVHRWELRCPHCGAARSITFDPSFGGSLALALFGVLGLSACGEGTASSSEGGTVTTAVDPETSGAETSGVITTTSGEETSTETGMLTFVPDTDLQAAYGQCDLWQQDCPEGEKCVPYASTGSHVNEQKCVPIQGDDGVGDPCVSDGIVEATDSCDGESLCWNLEQIEGELQGTCTAFCTGTPDDPVCDEGLSCLVSNEGTINLCVDTCNPLDGDQACDAWSCHWQEGVGIFGCWLGAQDLGQACEGGSELYDDCVSGSVCVEAELVPMCEGDRCCAGFCDLNEAMCDEPGTECVTLWENAMAPPGYEDLGVCIVPPL